MKLLPPLFSLLLVLLGMGSAAAQTETSARRVGVVLDGAPSRSIALLERVQDEVRSLSAARPLEFPEDKLLVGDFSLEQARSNVERLLADQDVDVVLGFGVLASHALASRAAADGLSKPALAPFMVAAKSDEPANGDAGPQHRGRLHQIVWPIDVERDLAAIKRLGPFRKWAWLCADHLRPTTTQLVEEARQLAKSVGAELVEVPVTGTAESALAALPEDADFVYFGPNPQLPAEEVVKLAQGLLQRRLPSFSWLGESDVKQGMLAGLGTQSDVERLVRRVALNLRALANGSALDVRPQFFARNEQLILNMATARSIGMKLDWSLITTARLLNQTAAAPARTLTLQQAVRLAVQNNLDLKALEHEVAAGASDITRARAQLLPQVGVSMTGVWIDADRAGLGHSERTLQWSANLTQVVYSEKAWANFSIQKHLQQLRISQQQLTHLDVVHATALGYLTLLKAKTLEHIQREQLAATREHLAAARVRVAVGSATKAEVARWESQLAEARRAVINAAAQRNVAEMEINRILNRPLEERFATQEATIHEAHLLSNEEIFRQFLDNKGQFEALREFMVAEAVANAPELEQLAHAKSAKQRERQAAKRERYAPSVALFAGQTHRLLQGGAGSDGADLSALPPGISLPDPNDLDWQVGVNLNLPLFEGGERSATIRKQSSELAQLEVERQALERRIEQRMRTALHRAGASLPGIALAQDSSTAARQTLEITEDAYAQGAATLVQMLDAQNQATLTQLAASNAAYDYLMDVIDVERALGRFGFFESDASTTALMRRLQIFATKFDRVSN